MASTGNTNSFCHANQAGQVNCTASARCDSVPTAAEDRLGQNTMPDVSCITRQDDERDQCQKVVSSIAHECAEKCALVRELTEEESKKLLKDTCLVSDFKRGKFEKEAQKNWDLFYKRNTTKFFKDRHWTTREFQDLLGNEGDEKLNLLEVGCGVGNFIFPLMRELEHIFFFACDFSPRAVQFVKDHPLYREDRCRAFQCDLTQGDLTASVPTATIDIVTMIFVLSAISPEKMIQALQNIHNVLKPGGCVLIRDYGLYDHAMLRFAPGHKLSENFYVRQDGTRAYYFTVDELAELFSRAGFDPEANDYILRETVNKKEGLCVPRVFVQGKFVKRDKAN